SSGLATLSGLSVAGAANVSENLSVSGHGAFDTLASDGLASVGTLAVDGAASAASLSVSNGGTFGGNLNVTGLTDLAALTASGLATLHTLDVTNTATISGQLDMSGSRIVNLGPPTDAADATTKSYVDAQIGEGISSFVEVDPTIGNLQPDRWC